MSCGIRHGCQDLGKTQARFAKVASCCAIANKMVNWLVVANCFLNGGATTTTNLNMSMKNWRSMDPTLFPNSTETGQEHPGCLLGRLPRYESEGENEFWSPDWEFGV